MKPSILEKLQQLSDRLEEVTHLLGQPEATSDMDNYRKLTREHAELTPVVEVFQNYQLAQSDLADAEEMLSDPEMKDFAAEEIEAAKAKIDMLDTELQKLLLPKDADDDKNIFIEVRAGTGGECGRRVRDKVLVKLEIISNIRLRWRGKSGWDFIEC